LFDWGRGAGGGTQPKINPNIDTGRRRKSQILQLGRELQRRRVIYVLKRQLKIPADQPLKQIFS